MEIELEDCIYCINPHRIIRIEYFMAHWQYRAGSNYERFSPNTPQEKLEKYREEENPLARFSKFIEIKMTDGETIKFRTDDDELYGELRDKLEKIVGR